jgi:hypothetical protein
MRLRKVVPRAAIEASARKRVTYVRYGLESCDLGGARQPNKHGSPETLRTLPQERSLGRFSDKGGRDVGQGRERPASQVLAILRSLPLLRS